MARVCVCAQRTSERKAHCVEMLPPCSQRRMMACSLGRPVPRWRIGLFRPFYLYGRHSVLRAGRWALCARMCELPAHFSALDKFVCLRSSVPVNGPRVRCIQASTKWQSTHGRSHKYRIDVSYVCVLRHNKRKHIVGCSSSPMFTIRHYSGRKSDEL